MAIRSAPTAEARDAMKYLVETSKRTSGVQLPHSFVRDGSPPPLARLIRGGRGGEVRLKLYLTACMIATRAPHRYTKETPAYRWATALSLPDPETHGARRISDAFGWLHEHNYLAVDRRQGRPPSFQLLSQSLDGTAYERPINQYVMVPLELWSKHWIAALTAAELAVLIAILDTPDKNPAGSPIPRYLTGSQKAATALSADTWTTGTAQLGALGVIEVDRQVEGARMMFRRTRNIYDLTDWTTREPTWPVEPLSG